MSNELDANGKIVASPRKSETGSSPEWQNGALGMARGVARAVGFEGQNEAPPKPRDGRHQAHGERKPPNLKSASAQDFSQVAIFVAAEMMQGFVVRAPQFLIGRNAENKSATGL